MTVAAGSGVDGDFRPAADQVINIDAFPDATINWRRVQIPPGVVVTVTGSRPATLKAIDIELEGEIRADGLSGGDAESSATLSRQRLEPDPFQQGRGRWPGRWQGR